MKAPRWCPAGSAGIAGDSLQGEFRSGHQYQTLWTGWKDPAFELGAADSLTRFKSEAKVSFSVKTPDGQDLSFPSAPFENKIKIFTVMGTWCPNCRDEQVFLRDFLKENPALAAEMKVVGFSFERIADPAKANTHLAAYKQKMELPYDIVYAGNANRAEAAKFFPALDNVMAFPTMMILDKQNRIRRVHTGFDGPATSKYAAFKADFAKLMNELR